MLRAVIFLLGLALMAISLVAAPAWDRPQITWLGRSWLFDLGVLLALGSHGWPDGLR